MELKQTSYLDWTTRITVTRMTDSSNRHKIIIISRITKEENCISGLNYTSVNCNLWWAYIQCSKVQGKLLDFVNDVLCTRGRWSYIVFLQVANIMVLAVTLTVTYLCSTSRQKRIAEDDNDNQPPILTHATAAGAIMLSKCCDISIAQREVKSRFARRISWHISSFPPLYSITEVSIHKALSTCVYCLNFFFKSNVKPQIKYLLKLKFYLFSNTHPKSNHCIINPD